MHDDSLPEPYVRDDNEKNGILHMTLTLQGRAC